MMFRVIGGIVVYGFALYGAAALVSRMKMGKMVRPVPGDLKGAQGGAADELDRQSDERRDSVQVGA